MAMKVLRMTRAFYRSARVYKIAKQDKGREKNNNIEETNCHGAQTEDELVFYNRRRELRELTFWGIVLILFLSLLNFIPFQD